MVQEPLGSQGLLIIKASQSHLAGLLWMSDQPNAETTTWCHATLTRDRHSCPGGIRTCNPSQQAAAHPRFRTHSDWGRPTHLITRSYPLMSVNYPWLFQTPLLINERLPYYYAVSSPFPTPAWHFRQTCLQLLWLVAQQMRVFCLWLTNS